MIDWEAPTVARSELKEATLSGLRWITLARIVAEMLALASVVMLARLVPPAEFGRAAVALIIQGLAILLSTDGFGTPLVQRRLVERAHLESAAALSLLAGAGLTAITILLAETVLPPVFGARTAMLVELISPAFLLAAVGVVPQARLQRELRFGRLSAIEVSSLAVGALVAVTLAIAGLDAEALVLGALATIATSGLLLLAAAPVTLPRLRRRTNREVASFGTPMALATLAGAGLRNVDYAILGAVMSPAQVGYYYRAFQLGVDYQRKITGIVQRLALPVYSRTESLEDMRRLRLRITRVSTTVVFPLLGTFIVIAPELVPWLFGTQWEPAVLPAQLLAVAGMAAAVVIGAGGPVVAAGRPDAMLRFNLARLAGYAVAVAVAAQYGLTAVCLTVVGFHLVVLLAAQRFLLGLLGVPFGRLWQDIAPGGISTLVLLALTFPLTDLLGGWGVPTVPLILAAVAVGGAGYVATLRLGFESTWTDMQTLLGKVAPFLGSRGRAEAEVLVAEPAVSQ